jgi:hypothetical protein
MKSTIAQLDVRSSCRFSGFYAMEFGDVDVSSEHNRFHLQSRIVNQVTQHQKQAESWALAYSSTLKTEAMSLRNVGLSLEAHEVRVVTVPNGEEKKREQNDAGPLNSVIKLHGGPTYGSRGS